jgi:hypothetical protein
VTKVERQLRDEVLAVLVNSASSGIDPEVRASIALEAIWRWLGEQNSPTTNRGQPWSDHEMRVILQLAPTHENIVRLARAFGRGVGAIEQIYRWAATPDKVVKQKRPDDSFVAQIKRISKEVGWEAF